MPARRLDILERLTSYPGGVSQLLNLPRGFKSWNQSLGIEKPDPDPVTIPARRFDILELVF
jgi:hypothetical protein